MSKSNVARIIVDVVVSEKHGLCLNRKKKCNTKKAQKSMYTNRQSNPSDAPSARAKSNNDIANAKADGGRKYMPGTCWDPSTICSGGSGQ